MGCASAKPLPTVSVDGAAVPSTSSPEGATALNGEENVVAELAPVIRSEPSKRKLSLSGGTLSRLPGMMTSRSGLVTQTQDSTAVAVLQRELADLEAMWAAETTSLLEMVRRKDEQIWQLVADQADGFQSPMGAGRRVALEAEAMAVGEHLQRRQQQQRAMMSRDGGSSKSSHGGSCRSERDVSGGGTMAPTPLSVGSSRSARGSSYSGGSGGGGVAGGVAGGELSEAEGAAQKITESGFGAFERELVELAGAASTAQRQQADRSRTSGPGQVVDGFKADKESGHWSYTVSSDDGGLWARGSAEETFFKGFVHVPGVRANALFDALQQPKALKSLLPHTLRKLELRRDAASTLCEPTARTTCPPPLRSNHLPTSRL